MKRVLVAGLQHESNSFNPIVAGKNDFQVIRGAEVFQPLPRQRPGHRRYQTADGAGL